MNDKKNVENNEVINNTSPNSNNTSPNENQNNAYYHSNNYNRRQDNPNKPNNYVGNVNNNRNESLPKDDLSQITKPKKPKAFTPTGANTNSSRGNNLNSIGSSHRKSPSYGMSSNDYQQSDNQSNEQSNNFSSNPENSTNDNSTNENKNGSPNGSNVKETGKKEVSEKNNEIKSKPSKTENAKKLAKSVSSKYIKEKIVKKLLKNPYVFLLGGLLFFIILIIIIGFYSGESAYGSVGGYCTTKQFDISDLEDTSVKTFENGLINWVNPSPQYTFFTTTETYTDSDGFLRSGDAYVVALGTYFGEEKGTKYLVTLENGKEFTIILGDTKSDEHTDPTHRFAQNGDIIEFMSGCGNDVGNVTAHTGVVPKCGTVAEFQSKIYELFPGNIKSIELVDNTRECNFNGQFYERNSSIYTDQNAINRILEIAPGVSGNYAPSLRYECVTYAKLRAIEILDNNKVLTDEQRAKAIAEVGNAQGNGWQWTAEDNPGLKNFNSDSSCTNFKAGSIIAYNGNGAKCTEEINGKTVTHYCGHVAIIESVDLEAGTYTISDSYKALNGTFRKLTLNIDNKNSSFGGCRGITYLLEYKG